MNNSNFWLSSDLKGALNLLELANTFSFFKNQ